MDKLLPGVDAAVRGLSRDGGAAAAGAIMTTDTRPKTTVVDGDGWSVGGMAKGAGMLAPGLATMLCVLTTDAVADSGRCRTSCPAATAATFDRVDSDGCQSTNDTVLLLASGASAMSPDRGRTGRRRHAGLPDLAAAAAVRRRGVHKGHRHRGPGGGE